MPTLFESAYHQFKSDEWIKFRLSELQSNYNKPHHEKNDIKASETSILEDDDHWHAIPHTELFDGIIRHCLCQKHKISDENVVASITTYYFSVSQIGLKVEK